MAQKQYGLIKSIKDKRPLPTKSTVFDAEDSSSDDEQLTLPAKLKGPQLPTKINRQIQLDINKAIKEDPNVFEYDSLYDNMKQESAAPKEKKPRYMETLLKTAELRKLEDERRSEKKIQKEREAEGNEFAEKDAFITTAYKEKLEELNAANLKEQRQKECEDILDVRKQNDMSGFYRHLLKQSVGEEKVTETIRDFSDIQLHKPVSKEAGSTSFAKPNIRSRQLRTRHDSSSSESSGDNDEVKQTVIEPSTHINKVEEEKPPAKLSGEKVTEKTTDAPSVETSKEPPKPKVSRLELIKLKFTKRTIDETFDAARQRFLERKKLRYG